MQSRREFSSLPSRSPAELVTLAVDGLELKFGDVAVEEHDALARRGVCDRADAGGRPRSWLARMGSVSS
jgi:hypothetical protein